MPENQVTLSVLIYTYNRADLVIFTIESILNQTYRDFELVLINNGSTDNTQEVLEKYATHEKVRIHRLEKNRGANGGLNYGLDQIRGEWFGIIGDDDTLVPHAFETMFKVLDEVDPTIDAITSNATVKDTGELSGLGLYEDQYLPLEVIITKVSGEFFGIAKTSLLGENRLNEATPGNANYLWHKIDAKANRYYIHQPLMIYNYDTSGDTLSAQRGAMNINTRVQLYKELLKEEFYWNVIQKYHPRKLEARSLRGMFFLKIAGLRDGMTQYQNMLNQSRPGLKNRLLSRLILLLPGNVLGLFYSLAGKNTMMVSSFKFFFRKW